MEKSIFKKVAIGMDKEEFDFISRVCLKPNRNLLSTALHYYQSSVKHYFKIHSQRHIFNIENIVF